MAISAALIKQLRDRTNAPMMDCKKALEETDGDMDKAIDFLRKKGLADAKKRAGRVAAEGIVSSYIHGEGRIGVLLEVNCETDFVARTDQFKTLVHELCLQIAASSPLYVRREEVSKAEIAKEEEIRTAQLKDQGKAEKIIPKILEGQINKWYADICLLEQTYNRDREKTIQDLVNEVTATTGEKINVRRFVRFEVGEGLEKRSNDLGAEVAEMLKA
ncbi:MAG: translation elongation factor Ts [Polyangia bacterium]|jgi:elongation factor Ts|nr:translation elongation factor Ts [Polyangia bacterium]